jgi:Flp pilus assembly protein TadB
VGSLFGMVRPDESQFIRLPAFGRWVVHTRSGRRAAIVFIGIAVLLGLIMGITHVSEVVSSVVVVVYVAIAVPVLFRLAIREGRRQESDL